MPWPAPISRWPNDAPQKSILPALPFFLEENFTTSGAGLWLYRGCAMAGLLLPAGAQGRLAGRRARWRLLAAAVLT